MYCNSNHPNVKRIQGLTLMEMLIALVILAVLSLGMFHLLQGVSQTQQVVSERGQHLQALARAGLLLSQDLGQVVVRPVRAQKKASAALPVVVQWHPVFWGNRQGNVMVLTRVGWSNPLHRHRSDVQQVIYRLEKGNLMRLYWPHLDADAKEKPQRQVVLRHVTGLRVRFLNGADHWQGYWFSEVTANNQGRVAVEAEGPSGLPKGKLRLSLLPAAVEVSMDDAILGQIRRIFSVPSGDWPDMQVRAVQGAKQ